MITMCNCWHNCEPYLTHGLITFYKCLLNVCFCQHTYSLYKGESQTDKWYRHWTLGCKGLL
uniref:Uncharacterized protein n=1 Tax=Anguilla anguilla TaxID=7936 RepID=A0A0E9RC32_ANGAN